METDAFGSSTDLVWRHPLANATPRSKNSFTNCFPYGLYKLLAPAVRLISDSTALSARRPSTMHPGSSPPAWSDDPAAAE